MAITIYFLHQVSVKHCKYTPSRTLLVSTQPFSADKN